jgi:hypothetical protein
MPDNPLMPDPSLLLGEDRDKNVAEWLVGQIFGAPTPDPFAEVAAEPLAAEPIAAEPSAAVSSSAVSSSAEPAVPGTDSADGLEMNPPGELDALAQGLFAQYFGDSGSVKSNQ